MKNRIFTGLSFAALIIFAQPVVAGEQEHHHGHSMHQTAAMSTSLIDGVVRKVDSKRAKVTLKHGEISQIDMPAMVMNYQVGEAVQLDGIRKGDKVRFAMDKVNGKFVVTHIELAQ